MDAPAPTRRIRPNQRKLRELCTVVTIVLDNLASTVTIVPKIEGRRWHSTPGNHDRNGFSLVDVMRKFPDDAATEAWIVQQRWPDCIRCDNVQSKVKHPSMAYRCRRCRKFFSSRTGPVMQGSNLGAQVWVVATTYILSTGIKGTSSMKLHRDLGITQKTAWHLAHRIRETWNERTGALAGPVEADEPTSAGKERTSIGARNCGAGAGRAAKPPSSA